jgi:hypothetical protein
MANRLDQLIERRIEFSRLGIHCGHFFEHVLGFGMLTLAVRDLFGLTRLVLGNRVYLGLLGARMRDE